MDYNSKKAIECGYNKLTAKGMVMTANDFLNFLNCLAKVYSECCKANFGSNYKAKCYNFAGVWAAFAKKIMQADGCAFNGVLLSATQLQMFEVEKEVQHNFLAELKATDNEVSADKLSSYFAKFGTGTIRFDLERGTIYEVGKKRESVQDVAERFATAFRYFAFQLNTEKNQEKNSKLLERKEKLLKELNEIEKELS